VYRIGEKLFIGLAGLATDSQTLYEKLKFRLNLYRLREEREMRPPTFASLVSQVLYEKRFAPYYVEPVIAGLDGPENKPYVCAMDLIGAPLFTEDFVLAGSCSESLYGMCESLWRPNLEPEDLFEVISQALMSSVDRDAMSGWGAIVHLLTKERVITRTLRARQD
jgi:20S proteasome subunit beta 3